MPSPWVDIQLLHRSHDFGPYRIQVDISHKGHKIILFITENGFVTVFKKVPRTVMAAIIILSIPSGRTGRWFKDNLNAGTFLN